MHDIELIMRDHCFCGINAEIGDVSPDRYPAAFLISQRIRHYFHTEVENAD